MTTFDPDTAARDTSVLLKMRDSFRRRHRLK
jgi:hypothetical protein